MLQFGEMSGSVQVKRMTPLRMDLGLTPGRRKVVDVSFIPTHLNTHCFIYHIYLYGVNIYPIVISYNYFKLSLFLLNFNLYIFINLK